MTAVTPTESVTLWIEQLKSGDEQAAQQLWERYFARMVSVAHRKLADAGRASADEEDVALSAFKSFCLGIQHGRYTQLIDRENLWPLLLVITANKSVDLIRRSQRLKRGGGLHRVTGSDEIDPLNNLISQEPDPQFVSELVDQLEFLLAKLDETGDKLLKQVAVLKMDGLSNQEVSENLGCARRTVERKLEVIQRLWNKAAMP